MQYNDYDLLRSAILEKAVEDYKECLVKDRIKVITKRIERHLYKKGKGDLLRCRKHTYNGVTFSSDTLERWFNTEYAKMLLGDLSSELVISGCKQVIKEREEEITQTVWSNFKKIEQLHRQRERVKRGRD